MNNIRMIDGVAHVWDIFENTWVTVDYWNQISKDRA